MSQQGITTGNGISCGCHARAIPCYTATFPSRSILYFYVCTRPGL